MFSPAHRHGKSTAVNDYWQDGGLSLLSTLAQYGGYLPNGFITCLFEVRLTMLPPVAAQAAKHHPDGQKYRQSGAIIDTKWFFPVQMEMN